jgi:hypothetical protein
MSANPWSQLINPEAPPAPMSARTIVFDLGTPCGRPRKDGTSKRIRYDMPKALPRRECGRCEAMFRPVREDQLFCSERCSMLALASNVYARLMQAHAMRKA